MHEKNIKRIKKRHMRWYDSSPGEMRPKNILRVVEILKKMYLDKEYFPRLN